MKPKRTILAAALMVLIGAPLLAAESTLSPILYPNAHYLTKDAATAQADIEACWQLARQTGASETNADRISQDAARDAAALALIGAAVAGALGGNPHDAAVAGAVGGGTASMAAGMQVRDDPPPVFRSIVERCLFEKGYEVAGWE